ncbi:hypothetical protein AAE478_009587 [Parahypoxylon ruwenzoriense]
MSYRILNVGRLRQAAAGVASAGAGIGLYYMYLSRVAHADSGAPKQVFGSGPAFLSLQLESTEVVNHNTKRLCFKLPEADSVSGLSLTYEPGVLEFLVKQYPNGKQSSYLHSLKPGDTLRFIMPIRGYKWQPNEHPEIMLVAGGAGITPAFQLIQGILRNPDDHTKIRLVFGVNTDADILLKKEFDEYEAKFPGRFKAVYAVSHPEVEENKEYYKNLVMN